MKKYGVKSIRVLTVVGILLFIFLMSPAKAFAAEQEDYSGYLGYSQLESDSQRSCYRELVDMLSNLESGYISFNEQDFNAAYDAVMQDHPELYSGRVLRGYGGSDDVTWFTYDQMYGAHEGSDFLANARNELEQKIQEIIASVPASVKSDYDKALFVHDYLVNNIDYQKNRSGVFNDQTVYAALVNGSCVCTGYAEAYTVLMNRLGVTTWTVIGYVSKNEELLPHAWNVSWINEQCVYTDVCWDDPSWGAGYDYFNRSCTDMRKDHFLNEEFEAVLGTCNHTGYEYKADNQNVTHTDLGVNTETKPVIPEETAPVVTEQVKDTVPAETTVPVTPSTTVPSEPSETTHETKEPTATEDHAETATNNLPQPTKPFDTTHETEESVTTEVPNEVTTNNLPQTSKLFEIEDSKTEAESGDDTNDSLVATLLGRMCLTLVVLILNAFGVKV